MLSSVDLWSRLSRSCRRSAPTPERTEPRWQARPTLPLSERLPHAPIGAALLVFAHDPLVPRHLDHRHLLHPLSLDPFAARAPADAGLQRQLRTIHAQGGLVERSDLLGAALDVVTDQRPAK